MKILLKDAQVVGFSKAGQYSITNLQVKRDKKSTLTMSFISNGINGDIDSLSIWVKDLSTEIPCVLNDLGAKKLTVSKLIEAGVVTLQTEETAPKQAIKDTSWEL